jgi:hypothetical protein
MIITIVMTLVDMVMEDILTTAVDITPHHTTLTIHNQKEI